MDNPNPQSQAPAETVVPEAETTTLEQIAKELSVEEQAQQFVASVPPPPYQQPQTYQPQPFQAPDPVTDPEGYRAYIARQHQSFSQLESTTQQIASELNNWKQQQEKQKLDKDVDSAVSKVNQKLNMDPHVTEALLEATYKRDPSFKRIWDNRGRNQQALDKALDLLAQKFVGQFSIKQDPQIAKNLQAAKSSQQTMSTTQKTPNEGIPTDPQEFQRWWQNAIATGRL